jgi:plasmid maintenance system antidote protein VapI
MNKALKSQIILKYGSQDNFSEHMRVSRSLVSNVIHGRRKLSFEEKVLWTVHLGCSLGEIFPDAQDE